MIWPRKIVGNIAKLMLFAIICVGIVALGIGGINFSRDPFFRRAVTQQRLVQIALASREYFKAYGKWPDSIASIVKDSRWHKLQTNDIWGHEIHYTPFSPLAGRGEVISYGRDNKPGGEGLNSESVCYFSVP